MSGIARIRPSRRFLIQQAILNAVQNDCPRVNPGTFLFWTTNEGIHLPGWLEAAVCREFRALSERWAA